MARVSAGLLMYRFGSAGLEMLLVHPGGPYWRKKDVGAWSIPKGEIEPGEDPLAAAQREFEEELGFKPAGEFIPLGEIRQRGGKRVHAWAFEGDCNPADIRSNTHPMEWPPRSGRWITVPEIDRADFFDCDTAARKINPAQAPFLKELRDRLPPRDNP